MQYHYLFLLLNLKKIKQTKYISVYKTRCIFIFNEKLIFRFFLSRLFYFDALATLFAFGVFMHQMYLISLQKNFIFCNFNKLICCSRAIIGGFYDRIISSFRVIQCCIISLIVFGIFLILIKNEIYFWVVSFFRSFIGPLQSSSRVLISDLVPSKKGGQFFGFAIFLENNKFFRSLSVWFFNIYF